MKPSKPKISIIIPTYNRGQPLIDTLQSLLKQNYSSREIIVVDQSTKKLLLKEKFLKKNKERVKLLSSSPPNAAAARNLGIKKAKGKIILFLDDDVVCHQNLIKQHLKNYTDSRIGAVCGRVISQGQKIEAQHHHVGQITWWGHFTDGFSTTIKQPIRTAITCNASWRLKILRDLGGFDENFTGPIREDSDLSLRTLKAGWQIIFEPQAVVTHIRAKSGGFRKTEGRLKWYRGVFRSETYFFLKHWPKFLLPLVLLTRFNLAVRCMFGFGREVSWQSLIAPWQGIVEGIKLYFTSEESIRPPRRRNVILKHENENRR